MNSYSNNICKHKLSNNIQKINENDIVINYVCFCKKYFYINEKIIFILPCCHIIHQSCFNKHIIDNQYNLLNSNKTKENNLDLYCPDCNIKINSVLSEKKINSKKKYKKYQNDIKAIRIQNGGYINYLTVPLGLIKLTTFVNKLLIINNESDLLNCIEFIIKIFNVKINIIDNTKNNPIMIKNNTVSWEKNYDEKNKLVIISNHSQYLDSIFLYYIFRCGFISSDTINKLEIGKLIATTCNLLVFKRGVDLNTVDKIKEYLDKKKRIVIYPEGTISNQDSLLRFRTGAFHTDAAVCPVIIKMEPFIYDDDFKTMILKIISQNNINISITINDFFYPPFDNEKIENIRDYMCTVGKLTKSRVSNRSIKN